MVAGRGRPAVTLELRRSGPVDNSESAEPSESPYLARSLPAGGDQPPNGADNNAWKQRHALSDADRRQGEQAAEKNSSGSAAVA